jgi:hypothetical protein
VGSTNVTLLYAPRATVRAGHEAPARSAWSRAGRRRRVRRRVASGRPQRGRDHRCRRVGERPEAALHRARGPCAGDPVPHERRRDAVRRGRWIRAGRRGTDPRVPARLLRLAALLRLPLPPRRAGAALRPALLRALGLPGRPRPRDHRRRRRDGGAPPPRSAAGGAGRRVDGRRDRGGRRRPAACRRGRRPVRRARHDRADAGHRRRRRRCSPLRAAIATCRQRTCGRWRGGCARRPGA